MTRKIIHAHTAPRPNLYCLFVVVRLGVARRAPRDAQTHNGRTHVCCVFWCARRATPKHTTVVHMFVVCLAIKQSARDARASRALCLIALARRDRFKTTIHHTMRVLLEHCVQ